MTGLGGPVGAGARGRRVAAAWAATRRGWTWAAARPCRSAPRRGWRRSAPRWRWRTAAAACCPAAPRSPDGPGRGPAAGILGGGRGLSRPAAAGARLRPARGAGRPPRRAGPAARESTGPSPAGAGGSSRSAPSTGRRPWPCCRPGCWRGRLRPPRPGGRGARPCATWKGRSWLRFGEPEEIFLNLNTPEDLGSATSRPTRAPPPPQDSRGRSRAGSRSGRCRCRGRPRRRSRWRSCPPAGSTRR